MVISDLSRCRPSLALSRRECGNRWQLLAYRTSDKEPKSGLMIGAPSFVAAPEVNLPLKVKGWHAVSIGFWIPRHDYDGATTIKVKLDNDPCFTRISEPEPAVGSEPRDCASLVKEAFFKSADLTGRRLVFGKTGGPFAQKAYIAYVRLTPLDDGATRALTAERARADSRHVQATIDGISYLWSNEYRTKEHFLELVEPYRDSDIGKVTWAFCYGDTTNYPSKIGPYWAGGRKNTGRMKLARNHYQAGMATGRESLKRLLDGGVIPQAVVAEHVHKMGLKFEAMFRLGIFGHAPPRRWLPPGQHGFVATHPRCRLCMSDGTPVEKASYAFPEVRAHMLAIIKEAAQTFAIDGVSLAFNRGPFFAAYEQPVLDDYRKQYGGDARRLPLNHPDLARIRSGYLTEFVRAARRLLDKVGAAQGKRLELSAWYEGQTRAQREYGGVDVETWIKEGLLDSAVGSVGKNDVFDPRIINAAQAHGCKCIAGVVCSGGTTHGYCPGFLANAGKRLYARGLDGIAIWDSDTVTATALWPAMRRMGHRAEFCELARKPIERPYIALKEVNGCNLETEHGRFGLGQAAYSCG